MNKIFKFTALISVCLMAFAGCAPEELNTDQYSDEAVTFAGFAPNPVARGGALRITGSNLQKVNEVILPGVDPITNIEVVSEGRQSEIRVIVPVDGPEVGKIAIVAEGKTYQSLAELTYSEPIFFTDFSPKDAMPGDEITLKGDYLNNIRVITFAGDTEVKEFVSQSRYEMKVVVPATAVTGKIILADVDPENNPDNLIANLFYSEEELVIGEPTVKSADRGVLKAGANVIVSGEYLDMIQSVNYGGVAAEFTVAEGGKSLTAVLPANAVDGELVLVSYAGVEHKAGAYQTLVPSEVKIEAESRYKAGLNAFVTGKDLDLVTGVQVSGVNASYVLADGKITLVVPAESADGDVVLVLANGKTVTVGTIEVVKPVIDVTSVPATVEAGKDLTIKGSDLDLVTSVVMVDNLSEVECAIVSATETELVITVNEIAASGIIIATAASGYDDCTDEIEVTYGGALNINIETLSLSIGSVFKMTGTGLINIANIFIKDIQVTEWVSRSENEISFKLPADLGPGVYRLVISLVTGETVTWGVPFEATASYTESFMWEGSENLGSWSNQPYFGAEDAFAQMGIAAGDMIRVYFTVNDPAAFWQFQVIDGHWGNLVLPELGNTHTVSQSNWDASIGYFTFEVTDAVVAQLTSIQGWGGAFLCQGENVTITGISLIQYGSSETILWEGEAIADDWGNQPFLLSDAGVELLNAGAQAGQVVNFYIEPLDPVWKVQIVEGHWGPTYMSVCSIGNDTEGGKFTEYDLESNGGKVSLTLTDEILAAAFTQGWWGGTFLLNGDNVKCTKVTLL